MCGDPLLERDAEEAAIGAGLSSALRGQGKVLLVVGEAGIGKTALLLRAGRSAERKGVRVLRASGAPLEREFGYGVVRQLLEREVCSLSDASRGRIFAGAAAHAAGVFGLPARDPAPTVETDPGFLVRHGLVWVVEALAEEKPVMLWVDDLQWVDGASLRWLAYLARRISDLPLLMLAGRRSGERAVAEEAIRELESHAAILRPAGLTAAAVATLTLNSFENADSEFVARCHQVTAGNPLLVKELLRAAREEDLKPTRDQLVRLEALGAHRVADLIVRRLARLGQPAQELAAAVAVLDASEIRDAAALSGLSLGDAEAAADELYAAGILAADRPVRFVHPLLRAAVEADLPPGARASAHRRAAILLDADPAKTEEAALHLLRADPAGDPWAVERLRAAAVRALDRGAPDAAAALLERALAEPPGSARQSVLIELGRAERRAGSGRNGAEHFAEALAHAAPGDRPRLARELAWTLLDDQRVEEAMAVLEAAVADLEGPENDVRDARLQLESTLAVTFGSDRLARRGLQRLGRFSDVHGRTPAERELQAAVLYAQYWTGTIDANSYVERLEALKGTASLLSALPSGSVAPVSLALAVFHADRVDLALSMLDELIAGARGRGDLPLLVGQLHGRGRILLALGELARAEAVTREAMELGREVVHAWGRSSLVATLIRLMVLGGRLEEASMVLDDLGDPEPVGPIGTPFVARMELRSAQGRHQEAVVDAEALLRRLSVRQHAGIRLRDVAAATFLAAGDRERAASIAAQGVQIARRWGAPSTIAPSLRVLGESTGDEAALSEAVALVDGGQFRIELLRALLALGAHLRRTNARARAREPLRRALDLAHRCGARTLAETAATELRACGARPRRAMLTGLGSLTASELRVAELVAGGHSNPQVAQALFITRSTVEAHLRSIFRKLQISSRDQIAPLLAGGKDA